MWPISPTPPPPHMYINGLRKLFKAYRDLCKYYFFTLGPFSFIFCYASLSLRHHFLGPPPPLYLYIVKITDFTRVLIPLLTEYHSDSVRERNDQCWKRATPLCNGLYKTLFTDAYHAYHFFKWVSLYPLYISTDIRYFIICRYLIFILN